MKVIQVFTVPISLCFLEKQSSFWNINNYNLHILCAGERGLLEEFGKKNDVSTYAVPFSRDKDLFNSLSNVRTLFSYFRRHQPIIVHGNTPKAAFLSMIAATLAGVPVRVYEMHGLPLETARWPWKIVYWGVEKLTCTLASHVIAVSPSLRRSAIQKRLVATSKISVMHFGSCNGIDAVHTFNPKRLQPSAVETLRTKLGITSNQPLVGYAGRLTPEKGIQELYDAWQVVKRKIPTAKLLVVGDCDERYPISPQLLSKLENDPTIVRVEHQLEVAIIYELIDFLALPSYREGLGNVVLEAAAMGKPSIVSRVTGLQDAVIEHQTGIFCRPKSCQDLTEKLLFYLQHPELVRKHGKTAQVRVRKQFFPHDVWQAKLLLYRRLVAATESVTLPNVSPIFQTTD